MKIAKRALRLLVTLGAAAAASVAGAGAFPEKPITMVVAYAPGGSTDQVGRLVAASMAKELGASVVVQNKPGANGSMGNAFVARSQADGYTVLYGNSSLLTNTLLYKSVPYQMGDFVPVAIVNEFPLVMVANPKLPAANLREFVTYAKGQQGKLNFASAGLGNSTHLASEKLKLSADIDMTHVPFSGSAPGVTAVMQGDVHTFFDTTVTVLPFVKGNRLKALAVASNARLPVLPDVPTVMESGFPDFGAVTAWQGVFVPANTPPEVVARLRKAVNAALADAQNRATLERQGGVLLAPDPNGQGALKYLADETSKWSALIKALNIKLE